MLAIHPCSSRRLPAIAVALLLGGCAAGEPPLAEPYDATLNRFVGQPEASLVAAWGVPTHAQDLAGGGQALQWDTLNAKGALACSTVVTTDAAGRIMRYHYDGSDCRPPGR